MEHIHLFVTIFATNSYQIVNINVYLYAILDHVVPAQSWYPRCVPVATAHYPLSPVMWSLYPVEGSAVNSSNVKGICAIEHVMLGHVWANPNHVSNLVKYDVTFVSTTAA